MRTSTEPDHSAAAVAVPAWPTPTGRALAAHALALAVVLLAVLAVIHTGEVGFTDEGVYSAQAGLLVDGSWSADLVATDVDPSGERTAVTSSSVANGQFTPYARHPLYPLLLVPFYMVGGQWAMLALSVIGTALAALFGSLIARRISPTLAIPALWLTGLGSPLLFDAYLVIAHSIAAAAVAALCVVTLRTFDESPPRWIPLAAAPLAALSTMLRSEGFLVTLAIGAVVGLAALAWPLRRLRWDRAVLGLAIGVSGVLAYLADSALADRITGAALSGSGDIDREPDALAAAWVSLVRPWHGPLTQARPSAVLMLLCAIIGAAALRLASRHRLLGLALLALSAGAAMVRALETPELISGLVPTLPVLVIGLIGLRRADLDSPTVRLLAAVSVLTTGALLATIYKEGGATEWGGRFFHVLIPLLVPLALLGARHLFSGGSLTETRAGWTAVVVMTMALSVSAVRANVEYRSAVASTVEQVRDYAASRANDTLIVVSTLSPTGSARVFWRDVIEGDPVITSQGMGDLHAIVEAAVDAGRTEVIVVTPLDPGMVENILGNTLEDLDWGVLDSRTIPHSAMRIVTLGSTR